MAAKYLDGVYLGSSEKGLSQTTYDLLKDDTRFNTIDTAPILAADSNYTFRFPFPDEVGTSIGNFGNTNSEDLRGVIFKVPSSVFQLSAHVSVDATYDKTGIGFTTTCPDLSPAVDDEVTFEIFQQEYVNDGANDVLATVVRCWHCSNTQTITETEAQAIYDYLYPQGESRLAEQLSELSEGTKESTETSMSVLQAMIDGYSYNA